MNNYAVADNEKNICMYTKQKLRNDSIVIKIHTESHILVNNYAVTEEQTGPPERLQVEQPMLKYPPMPQYFPQEFFT